MGRLQELAKAPGAVEFQLNFMVDEYGTPTMRGHLHAELTMTCLRCLNEMSVVIDRDIEVGFVFDDAQAAQVSSRMEACTLNEDRAVLADLLEDELILALPIVALHTEDECAPIADNVNAPAEQEPEVENPFAVLRDLKPR